MFFGFVLVFAPVRLKKLVLTKVFDMNKKIDRDVFYMCNEDPWKVFPGLSSHRVG